jgi:hypothetical protein
MRNFIQNYVTTGSNYDPLTLPVANPYWHETPPTAEDFSSGVYQNVPVKVLLTLLNLAEVDTAAGSITMAVYFDLFWTDHLLSWDPQWTDGYEFISVDPALVWRPDVQLYNIVGDMDDQMGTPDMFMNYDGSMWWDSNGLITFTCSYDTSMFPFDQQKCTAVFGSWTYASYQMNVSVAKVQVEPSFTNLAWEVTGVSGAVTEELQWGRYPYSFAQYTVSLTRYSNHYLTTAIVPTLLVTYLALLALWVQDVPTRLSIAITALLTLIAVQVSYSLEVH